MWYIQWIHCTPSFCKTKLAHDLVKNRLRLSIIEVFKDTALLHFLLKMLILLMKMILFLSA